MREYYLPEEARLQTCMDIFDLRPQDGSDQWSHMCDIPVPTSGPTFGTLTFWAWDQQLGNRRGRVAVFGYLGGVQSTFAVETVVSREKGYGFYRLPIDVRVEETDTLRMFYHVGTQEGLSLAVFDASMRWNVTAEEIEKPPRHCRNDLRNLFIALAVLQSVMFLASMVALVYMGEEMIIDGIDIAIGALQVVVQIFAIAAFSLGAELFGPYTYNIGYTRCKGDGSRDDAIVLFAVTYGFIALSFGARGTYHFCTTSRHGIKHRWRAHQQRQEEVRNKARCVELAERGTGSTRVVVRTLNGAALTLMVDLSGTVRELKDMVYGKTDVRPEAQRLMFNAKELGDGEVLNGTGLTDGATVALVKKGGVGGTAAV